MFTFKDPTGTARVAVVAVCSYAGIDLLSTLAAYAMPSPETELGLSDALAILDFIVLLTCMVLVARWIYRTNANAHSLTDDVSISPGWAIGWFFIPFANLVKPYEAMKQTWAASHQLAGDYEEAESSLVRWWWALWLITNFGSYFSMRFNAMADQPVEGFLLFDILLSFVNVVLCYILIQMMQRLSRAQVSARHGAVFA